MRVQSTAVFPKSGFLKFNVMRNSTIIERVVKLGRRVFIPVGVNDVYTTFVRRDYRRLYTSGSVRRASVALSRCRCVLGNNSLQSRASLDTIENEGDDLLATTWDERSVVRRI